MRDASALTVGVENIPTLTFEAMELEEEHMDKNNANASNGSSSSRLKRLGFVAFGGTLGGILGSLTTALYADTFHFTGLLLLSALLLEVSARFSIYIGKIMKFYWSLTVKVRSEDDLQSLDSLEGKVDTSLKRSGSSQNFRTMKKVSSGNSLHELNSLAQKKASPEKPLLPIPPLPQEADSFKARLLRGLTTILSSNLLITIFTYNALYASTTTLLSFHRAELVGKRNLSVEANTSFLATINMISSFAVLCMQVSGGGAKISTTLGVRGTLALMPLVRLVCVIALFVWKIWLKKPVGLWIFIVLDESTRIINLSVAKPVRESLWRGLSNEARYEAKPLVDTVANRWGGGSAAFLVTVLSKVIGKEGVMGMCCGICAWWVGVAFNLGMVRRKIDEELERQNKDK
ncbi:hypothetical protein TrVE_jg10588 [Triparma verrucosa]|uniref:ADP,ATP carrier protein n=2 Tax=Triparma TaxID=722752 RepID=A0A9W6ZLI8_9STRA|nr:hypothetical protein TrST_g14069 [Triparma strigata]GMI02532.1 hypothetical protein TrVE_jg10588 [Triparma verrucosa]